MTESQTRPAATLADLCLLAALALSLGLALF